MRAYGIRNPQSILLRGGDGDRKIVGTQGKLVDEDNGVGAPLDPSSIKIVIQRVKPRSLRQSQGHTPGVSRTVDYWREEVGVSQTGDAALLVAVGGCVE